MYLIIYIVWNYNYHANTVISVNIVPTKYTKSEIEKAFNFEILTRIEKWLKNYNYKNKIMN